MMKERLRLWVIMTRLGLKSVTSKQSTAGFGIIKQEAQPTMQTKLTIFNATTSTTFKEPYNLDAWCEGLLLLFSTIALTTK
jgi:hypothetical protein